MVDGRHFENREIAKSRQLCDRPIAILTVVALICR